MGALPWPNSCCSPCSSGGWGPTRRARCRSSFAALPNCPVRLHWFCLWSRTYGCRMRPSVRSKPVLRCCRVSTHSSSRKAPLRWMRSPPRSRSSTGLHRSRNPPTSRPVPRLHSSTAKPTGKRRVACARSALRSTARCRRKSLRSLIQRLLRRNDRRRNDRRRNVRQRNVRRRNDRRRGTAGRQTGKRPGAQKRKIDHWLGRIRIEFEREAERVFGVARAASQRQRVPQVGEGARVVRRLFGRVAPERDLIEVDRVALPRREREADDQERNQRPLQHARQKSRQYACSAERRPDERQIQLAVVRDVEARNERIRRRQPEEEPQDRKSEHRIAAQRAQADQKRCHHGT